CAVTLAHELQHLKLGALLDIVTLALPDDGRRYYAPWRDDPRPLGGLLQGAYAYFGVSGFWRPHWPSRHSDPADGLLAQALSSSVRWLVRSAPGRTSPCHSRL